METITENIVQESATLNRKKIYSFDNLLVLDISMILLKSLLNDGLFNHEEYAKAREIILANHGLKLTSIYG